MKILLLYKQWDFSKCFDLITIFLLKIKDFGQKNGKLPICKINCKSLRATNDNVDCVAALVQSHNRLFTKNEEQLQFLLQVVSEHRCASPRVLQTKLTHPENSEHWNAITSFLNVTNSTQLDIIESNCNFILIIFSLYYIFVSLPILHSFIGVVDANLEG